jgi:hypothetical protein
MKKIAIGIIIFIVGFIVYVFLSGKLFAFSPVILGFNKHELKNTICYTQKGSEYSDFELIDTLISFVQEFHELKFTDKPKIFIFYDSLTYIHRSLSKARFCAFSSGRLFISPWALKEARQERISIQIYVRHELSHVLILQNKGIFSELSFPKWLLEGIAVYSANQMGTSFYPSKDETYKAIVQGNFIQPNDFKTKNENITILNVKNPIAFIYSEFACIVDYLIQKYGKEKFILYLKELIKMNGNDEIFKNNYGVGFDETIIEFKKYATRN